MNKRGKTILEGELLKRKKWQCPIIFQEKNSRGQVWVETVIYLLIAFAMMGLVLSFVKPKVEEIRDKAIIDQSLEIIKNIDNIITDIGSSGNKRLLEIGIKKGSLIINSSNDKIIFEMDSRYAPSESEEKIQLGNIEQTTISTGKKYKVILERDFSEEYNLSYRFEENSKTLTKSSTPYNLFLTNEGELLNKIRINFDIE